MSSYVPDYSIDFTARLSQGASEASSVGDVMVKNASGDWLLATTANLTGTGNPPIGVVRTISNPGDVFQIQFNGHVPASITGLAAGATEYADVSVIGRIVRSSVVTSTTIGRALSDGSVVLGAAATLVSGTASSGITTSAIEVGDVVCRDAVVAAKITRATPAARAAVGNVVLGIALTAGDVGTAIEYAGPGTTVDTGLDPADRVAKAVADENAHAASSNTLTTSSAVVGIVKANGHIVVAPDTGRAHARSHEISPADPRYGAVDDAITDSHAAIQAALDDAAAAGSVLMFPPTPGGGFVTSKPLLVQWNAAVVRGAGEGLTKIINSGGGPTFIMRVKNDQIEGNRVDSALSGGVNAWQISGRSGSLTPPPNSGLDLAFAPTGLCHLDGLADLTAEYHGTIEALSDPGYLFCSTGALNQRGGTAFYVSANVDGTVTGFVTLRTTGGGIITYTLDSTGTYTADAMTHVELVYDGTAHTFKLFLNGVLEDTESSIPTGAVINQWPWESVTVGSAPAQVLNLEKLGYCFGECEQVRISSVARHSSGFTPPTTKYATTSDPDTVFLCTFDELEAESFRCYGTVPVYGWWGVWCPVMRTYYPNEDGVQELNNSLIEHLTISADVVYPGPSVLTTYGAGGILRQQNTFSLVNHIQTINTIWDVWEHDNCYNSQVNWLKGGSHPNKIFGLAGSGAYNDSTIYDVDLRGDFPILLTGGDNITIERAYLHGNVCYIAGGQVRLRCADVVSSNEGVGLDDRWIATYIMANGAGTFMRCAAYMIGNPYPIIETDKFKFNGFEDYVAGSPIDEYSVIERCLDASGGHSMSLYSSNITFAEGGGTKLPLSNVYSHVNAYEVDGGTTIRGNRILTGQQPPIASLSEDTSLLLDVVRTVNVLLASCRAEGGIATEMDWSEVTGIKGAWMLPTRDADRATYLSAGANPATMIDQSGLTNNATAAAAGDRFLYAASSGVDGTPVGIVSAGGTGNGYTTATNTFTSGQTRTVSALMKITGGACLVAWNYDSGFNKYQAMLPTHTGQGVTLIQAIDTGFTWATLFGKAPSAEQEALPMVVTWIAEVGRPLEYRINGMPYSIPSSPAVDGDTAVVGSYDGILTNEPFSGANVQGDFYALIACAGRLPYDELHAVEQALAHRGRIRLGT